MRNDISLLRTIAIVAIVYHHSLCIYYGWPPNSGIETFNSNVAYLVCFLSKELGLGIFTFISGLLLSLQRERLTDVAAFITKKCGRILIPSIFFGLLYVITFPTFMYGDLPSCINGTHLWYLPMIFLCMVVTIPILFDYKHKSLIVVFVFLITCSLSKTNRTFMEFTSYYPIFIIGYYVDCFIERKYLIISCLLGGSMADPFKLRPNQLKTYSRRLVMSPNICYC